MINQTWITTWDHLSIQWFSVSYQVASYYYNPSDWHSLIFLEIVSVHIYIYIHVCSFQNNFQWNPNTLRWEPWEPQKPRETRTLPGSFLPLQMWIHQVKTCKLQSPEIFVLHQFFFKWTLARILSFECQLPTAVREIWIAHVGDCRCVMGVTWLSRNLGNKWPFGCWRFLASRVFW